MITPKFSSPSLVHEDSASSLQTVNYSEEHAWYMSSPRQAISYLLLNFSNKKHPWYCR